MRVHELSNNPVHLGLGATAIVEPDFTGEMSWYEAYGARHEADGAEGRLVSMHSFTAPWESWEMHPKGAEVVLCVAGRMVLHQEMPAGTKTIALGPGEYAINPPGVWHTADIEETASAVFITAGLGTEIRPR
ncbi:MAG: cupin domain-containing protein [Burkholderiales bacterium]|nr:cupin domain-containing protein [Burkholderiales bacterium]